MTHRRVILAITAAVAGAAACTGPRPGVPPPTTPESVAPLPTPAPTDAVELLLARPLRLPRLAPGQACPLTPHQTHSPVYQPSDARGPGPGPLYPIALYLGNDSTVKLGPRVADGLHEHKIVWASTTGIYTGPAIVRVGRLDGPGRGYVKQWYNPEASRGDAVLFELGDTPQDWPAATYVSGPGCWAYQIDGLDFTQIIVFRVVP